MPPQGTHTHTPLCTQDQVLKAWIFFKIETHDGDLGKIQG